MGAVSLALIGVIALILYLLQSQQDVRSRAAEEPTPAQIAQSCPIPAQVQNVLVEFPNCVGDICNFTQASCSWSSVAGATKYQVKVSQVESGEVAKNEQVEAAVTKVEFPIVQNKTYKCDVSAINSCGTSGLAGSHSLLCAVDALVSTPTPAPPTPTIAKVDCGFPCSSTTNCNAGQICAVGASGQGYCSIPSAENACKSSPSISSCCNTPTSPPSTPAPTIPSTSAPTPGPTLPSPGQLENSTIFGATTAFLLILGLVLLAL